MTYADAWYLFQENWFMSVTMAFGSFIAGATSEGGGRCLSGDDPDV